MVITADKHRVDVPALEILRKVNTDIPILLISRSEELDFNEEIFSLVGKKYVIADYIEIAWNWDRKETLIIGKNTENFPDVCKSDSWLKLDKFIKENEPYLYFKRELLEKDKTDKILPIEYVNWQPEYPEQTKEEYLSRPIESFHFWGRSHEARLIYHGEVWKNAAKRGYAVCDNIYYFNHFINEETNPRKWLSFWMPHYSRIDIRDILKINGMAKVSVSLPGAGVKCFRSTGESLVNSVMCLPEDNLAYSYPLIDGQNCIKFILSSIDGISKEWKIIECIENALRFPEVLYEIYKKGLKAAKWYQVDNYTQNYLAKHINS